MSLAHKKALRVPSYQRPSLGYSHTLPGWRTEDAVLVKEGAFQVELLRFDSEKEQGFRLRHQLFAETLRWVPEHPSGLEIDTYDDFTEMMALLDSSRRVLGLVRMHESNVPYMIEKEFAVVLGSSLVPFKGRDTAELTRFGVHPEARTLVLRTEHGKLDAITLMMKGLYRWSQRRKVRTLYAVTDDRVLRILRIKGLLFEPMAEPKLMPDGVSAVAVRMDWASFEAYHREKRPELLAWFNQDETLLPNTAAPFKAMPEAPISRPWQQPVAGSRHQASSRCS